MQARYLQDSLVPELVPPEPFNKIGEILDFPKELPLEHIFKVGDRVYQANPNSSGIIQKISRGKAEVNVDDGRIVSVKLDQLNHCDPNFKPVFVNQQEIEAIAEQQIQRALEKYLQENLPLEHKKQCDTLIYSQESEALRLPQKLSEEYTANSSLKLIQMPKPSCDRNGEISQYIATSEITDVLAESSISLPQVSHVQIHQLQETEQELKGNIVNFGLKHYESSENADQLSLSSKTQQDYSIEEWEQSLKAYPKAGTMRSGKLSVLPKLEQHTVEKGFLSLPTPNASANANSRPAGQTRCELWFRSNELLQDSQCLSPQIMAQLLGFPKDWTKCLWELKDVLGVESVVDTCLGERSFQPVQPLHLEESSISIPSSKKYPPEQTPGLTDSDQNDLYDRLARLESERDQIRATGPIAICGVWIEYGKVAKRKFRQAYYRSTKAIFPAKRQSSFAKSESGLVKRSYIGEENSKEVKAAGEAIARRNRLMAIAKEIKQIEDKLCE